MAEHYRWSQHDGPHCYGHIATKCGTWSNSSDHLLINPQDQQLLPADLSPQMNIHTDGIFLLGTAIGLDQHVTDFLDQKLQKVDTLLEKVHRINSLEVKYHILRFLIYGRGGD